MPRKDKLTATRDAIVTMDNNLIQHSKYTLSANAQKLLLYLIAQTGRYDTEFQPIEFSLIDFCKVCDTAIGTKTYQLAKETIQEIADVSAWVRCADGKDRLLRWITDAEAEEKTDLSDSWKGGYITIKFHKEMENFLLHLRSHFTQLEMLYILGFRHKYTIRLYMICKSIGNETGRQTTIKYALQDFKNLMGAFTWTNTKHKRQIYLYPDFKDFKRRVITPALEEVNAMSDVHVTITPLKTGNKVTAIELSTCRKTLEETLAVSTLIERKLGMNSNQLTLWSIAEEQADE